MLLFRKTSLSLNLTLSDVKLNFLAWRTCSAWLPLCTVQKQCSWGELKIYLSENNNKLNMFCIIFGQILGSNSKFFSIGLRQCTPAWPVLCSTTMKTQIDHRRSKKTGHLPIEPRFAINHSFMVFIIIPMIYQVDRARRKEVAVKVRERKSYRFRDEVRSEESGHGRIYDPLIYLPQRSGLKSRRV